MTKRNVAMLGSATTLCLAMVTAPVAAPDGPAALELANKGEPAVCLFTPLKDAAAQRAVERWRAFLTVRGWAVKVAPPSAKPDLPPAGAVMAFESADTAPIAKQVEAELGGLDGARPDAYLLLATNWNGRPLILAVGKTSAGTDCAAARLLGKVGCWDGKATIAPCEELAKPFFNVREMMLCPRNNYERWKPERLAAYPEFLKACGFNSVQIAEILTYWGHNLKRSVVAPAIRTVAKSAHEQGMLVSQFVWGCELQSGGDDFLKLQATNYADVVDHLVTHWGDPGNGNYANSQQITTKLLEEYRKINPKTRATVSTWVMHRFWRGNPQAKSFLDETFSPKAIGIALHRWWDDRGKWGKKGNENIRWAEKVLKASRRLGIWGWYLGDYEMGGKEHLRTRILNKYFDSLPDSVSTNVDWVSIEKVNHGDLARINQYVAGQKMWNPHRPLRAIMMDYCRSMYGPVYAETVCDAFEAVEEIQRQVITGNIPEWDRFPKVEQDDAWKARTAGLLTKLEAVKLPADWQPNLADVGSVANDVERLKARLSGKK